ncbi:MAG TPA: dethiobiotin synthase, partial [Pasteurellaceae bacterium]|nr:dethiobiotin synthase [Pasteurellaceae bacterium]
QALQNIGVQIVGYKPLACAQEEPLHSTAAFQQGSDYDSEDNPDVLTLLNSTNEKVSYQEINSYTFNHTMPMLSAEGNRVDIAKINRDLTHLASHYQTVLVEGSFGWL